MKEPVHYNKGLNMMIEIEYFLTPSTNEDVDLESVWDHLYEMFWKTHIIVAIDIEYLLSQPDNAMNMVGNNIELPSLPGISSDRSIECDVPGRKRVKIDSSLQKGVLKPSITKLINKQLENEKKVKRVKRKIQKRRREDEEWKRNPPKKRKTKSEVKEVDVFNDEDLSWKNQTVILDLYHNVDCNSR